MLRSTTLVKVYITGKTEATFKIFFRLRQIMLNHAFSLSIAVYSKYITYLLHSLTRELDIKELCFVFFPNRKKISHLFEEGRL